MPTSRSRALKMQGNIEGEKISKVRIDFFEHFYVLFNYFMPF